jgi:hypothetical protein
VEYNHALAEKLVDLSVPFVTPARNGLIWRATYGRPFASLLTGKDARLDFGIVFDGKTTKGGTTSTGTGESQFVVATATAPPLQVVPAPHDRLTAAFTVSQSLSDRISVPLSLIWRDHEEWLPGTSVVVPFPISPPPGSGNGHTTPFRTTRHDLEVRIGISYRIPSAPPPNRCCCCR